MHLAAAIRAWGRAHRSEIDSAEFDAMGVMYKRVRDTEWADVDVVAMTRDDAKSIMALFPTEEREESARRLNVVRKWTLAEAEENRSKASDAGDRETGSDSGEETDAAVEDESQATADIAGSDASEISVDNEVADGGDVQPRPAAVQADGAIQADGAPVDPDDVPTQFDPNETLADDSPEGFDTRSLALIGATILIAAGLALVVFFRATSSDDPAVDPDAPVEAVDLTPSANEFFLDQFDLSPGMRVCLLDEFDDLAAAATDMSELERPVCGTQLIEIISPSLQPDQ